MFWCGWILFIAIAFWIVPPTVWFVSRRLTRQDALPEHADHNETVWPRVSLIVPARNEADVIEAALESMLRSQYPNLQILLINDRSTDNTGDIIDRLAAADERCTVFHITDLPSGWLGKNHAMHVAANSADGDYLLFSDADVVYEPGAIESAIAWMREHQLQHLCLLPRMIPGRFFENCIVSFFGFAFAIGQQVHLIRTQIPFAYAGVGAFNLIEAECYRKIGGHTKIAMDVVDDVKLGKLVKRFGGRQDFLGAPDLLSLRWYPNLKATIKGLEKNGFAALDYSITKMIASTVLFFATMIAPYLVPCVTSLHDASGFLATIAAWHFMYGLVAVSFGGSLLLVPFFPVAASLLSFAFWNSTWVTLRNNGVTWRDSRYDLQELKAAVYR